MIKLSADEKTLLLAEFSRLKRTPLSERFVKQLIKANDQICFSALHHWQFGKLLKSFPEHQECDYTSTIFPENPYADSIYRKLSDLRVFSSEAELASIRMGIIASVAYVLAYLEEVQVFRGKVCCAGKENITADAEEEKLRLKIAYWGGASVKKEYFQTLGFLRLLRNHYAHVNSNLHRSFKSYIQKHGATLDKFWDNGFTDTHGFVFREFLDSAIGIEQSFGVLNIVRVCVQHIDAMVCDTIKIEAVVKYQMESIFSTHHNRQLRVERLSSKLRQQLIYSWNIHLSPDEAIAYVQQFTRRAI